ncbi:L-seryl-tRNA(Sec) selenium transferase [Phycicoccus sonneratiae]|uniref:L-seryl-tRNA(Sec) selenium transferase n=1 Tax=Phycicoccus sonneratiae TaxID=2807628 RepID=A0ABS2CRY8_9MICO|nr:L-seryl-tRNA(Sec) selenium transferase [Phycicoccus sonneraticus]MBM6402585.1 L-seryl-tRNA(Sec) selenium transferase [Phycicoccus sonneraticus]
MSDTDARAALPRTDALLADADVVRAATGRSPEQVRRVVRGVLSRARAGELAVDAVRPEVLHALAAPASSLTPVLNATGVVVHTNLGRAPLSEKAVEALVAAAGHTDVELDLATGRRGRRGSGALVALLEAVPGAEAALVVNNAAAALLLAATALAQGREVLVSRGEMVEIGDGFRLPPLIESAGARIREVGMTNRTALRDYEDALGPDTGLVLKVHPSNYRVTGFTGSASVRELAGLPVPLVVDAGSGLLAPDPLLPDELDAATALADGADVVLFSGDKLLGGPQAGILLGRAEVLERLRRHPMARALRVDKLTLAALEATLRGPVPPVPAALHLDPAEHRRRTAAVREAVGAGEVVPCVGRVGGGGGAGVELPGVALAVPEACAARLRSGSPPVVARVEGGRCLVDLRCVAPEDDARLAEAVRAALVEG